MISLSKPATDLAASRPVSTLAIVTLFSLVGLAISLAFARYGIDVAIGM
ncbi:hypothetical protein [Bradyrhizobium genosp. P]